MTSKIEQLKIIPDSKLKVLLSKASSISSALQLLDLSSRDNRLRKIIIDRAENLGIKKFSDLHKKFRNKKYTVVQVKEAADKSSCWSELLHKIGLSPYGGNTKTIRNFCVLHKIDTSHFDSVAAMRKNKRTWKYEEIFRKDSKYSRTSLPAAVKKFRVLEEKCAKCNNGTEWQREPLVLQIDHVNGTPTDNRVENLRWLCPNCHSQTPTYMNKKR